MKKAKSLVEVKQDKALDMVGKKMEMQISHKAISIDDENKTATFVMSTENIDRHGDIIDQESWILNYFKQAPMFFLQHDSDEFPIGKWLEVHFESDPLTIGKKMLVGTAEFRTEFEDASRAFVHVQKGDMSMVSVGFIPHRVDYDEARDAFILYDCELLECSLVGVGSNRQALVKEIDAKDSVLEAKKALDEKIKNISEKNTIISILKARENLNKALRRM
jgi:HK97 family phage prohead protease